MKRYLSIIISSLGILVIPVNSYGQENESAEISLEEVEDEFQQNFYEALKNKAIENYDKAVDFLLECKHLDPENEVVDFELGKNYILLKKYMDAENHLINAVKKEPDNIWYLDALFNVYKSQKNETKAIEVAQKLSEKDSKYKIRLVNLYVKISEYKKAISVLDELDKELGSSYTRDSLRAKIKEAKDYKADEPADNVINRSASGKKENPLDEINEKIILLTKTSNYTELLKITDEALENYPAQVNFYYSKGFALNKLKKHGEAIETLLAGIDYLVDDTELEGNIYRELMLAYEATGNQEKAKEFQNKIKTGL
ncbi:tetratricopeptide repeat protein [Abyssalbus ytuae]|uniref:Tetratricopeptide repeat protein n=1 Tax=Abyssalbus ytuae TaxID=2926907 RepID=A0A9E6ZSS8_9FLAO|nr:hypothetical protein [Abyssalbus ytuae]UOB16021.1 hypothetical protein MQE35_09740 [Abyssalbus ytuae]